MPLDYASYQIVLGQFEEAIETLEQGRALIWSEMRGLRTQRAQVAQEVSPSTERLSEINKALAVLTTSTTPTAQTEIEDDVVQGRNRMDSFGRLIIKQRNGECRRMVLSRILLTQVGFESVKSAHPVPPSVSAA